MAAPWRGGGSNDGWNDPPMFNYNAAASTPGKSPGRTLLNKRVAYPLSPGNASASPPGVNQDSPGVLLDPKDGPSKLPPVQILPPTSSTSVHPPVPLLVPNMSPPVDTSGLPPSFASAAREPFRSETLPELLERLQLDSGDSLRKYTKRVLHETVDKLKDALQGRSREDVQQRLGVLDDQWRDEKISEGAKIKLGCLASAIQNDDLKCADSLHLSLMVDHIAEVSQWMVGVKKLINELKLLHPPMTVKKVEEKQVFAVIPNPSQHDTNVDTTNVNTDTANISADSSASPAAHPTDEQDGVIDNCGNGKSVTENKEQINEGVGKDPSDSDKPKPTDCCSSEKTSESETS